MKKHLLSLVLALCVSTLFLSLPVYADGDTTPPSLAAWLTGDILRAEAGDRDSGVEAVYVNGHRFGYLVDGVIEVAVKDYAGTGEHIVVHALDYAGNKSEEIKLDNPHYKAPAEVSTPEQTPTTPAPTPRPTAATEAEPVGSTAQTAPASNTVTAVQASTPANSTAQANTESAVSGNPFTPDGTGSVQDNATEEEGKEFFTITTESDNTFFLVVDRQRNSDGVYLLNSVTENDLMALAEKSDTPTVSAIPEPEPDPMPTPELEPEDEPEEDTVEPAPESKGTSAGMIGFMVLVVLGVGGAGYYLKVVKPRQSASPFEDEGEDYGDGEEEYPEEDGEYLDDFDYSAEDTGAGEDTDERD